MSGSLAIDEVTLSKGELYTFITSKHAGQRSGTLVACIQGTRAEEIISRGKIIPEGKRMRVKEISMDMAPSMKLAASTLFPQARIVTDRFHVVRLVIDAVQQIRIDYRKKEIEAENREITLCRKSKRPYNPKRYDNGDTRKELLARSRYLLYHFPKKGTKHQQKRAKILFREYPKLKLAYSLAIAFRKIYETRTIQSARRLFGKWYKKVAQSNLEEFNSVVNSIKNHFETILNFFFDRSTNAFAESFNAKIKLFRANLRGVTNQKFFLFRLEKLFA